MAEIFRDRCFPIWIPYALLALLVRNANRDPSEVSPSQREPLAKRSVALAALGTLNLTLVATVRREWTKITFFGRKR